MTYGESLRAAWLFTWRGGVIGGVGGVVIGLLIGAAGYLVGASREAVQVVMYCVVIPVSSLVLAPWVMRMMMQKRFQGFRLQIVRSAESQ